MSELPVIGITMGDPAGIGPEIIVSALADRTLFDICRPVVLGDAGALSHALSKGTRNTALSVIESLSEPEAEPGGICLLELSKLEGRSLVPGQPTVEGGRAMVDYIVRAARMCLDGSLGAMVTCPISKTLMHQAGYKYDGHTQLIAQLTNTDEFVMMLAGEKLRVALVTIHCALKDVPAVLNTEMVYRTIRITAKALKEDMGFEAPRLAVAALNPHAGEEGLFGTEEKEIIGPAVDMAGEEGCNVTGPLPADTLFYKAASGQFEAVIAMYHDQGLIPLKLLHFSDAVNLTLGLPIVRTSVDHGTAYDIAGKGRADASSLTAAIRLAAGIAQNRGAGKI